MGDRLDGVGRGLLAASLLLAGCAGSEDGGSSSSASRGQPVEPWLGYCVATFTEDFTVVDTFDDPLLTVHAGDAYLMAEYGAAFGEDRATLVYLAPGGPYTFEVGVESGTQAFPFTSNCTPGSVTEYYAVFTDVSIFDSAELSTRLCDLSAGSVVVRDATSIAGYAAVGGGLSGPATYEVMLNAFSDQCGGASEGYISVPQTEALGSTTWLVPIIVIIGPGS